MISFTVSTLIKSKFWNKKRTAYVGAILSLIPLGQPLTIKTGVVLSTTRFLLSVSEKVSARDNSYYFDLAFNKGENGDYYGAIADYKKVISLGNKETEQWFQTDCADWCRYM